MHPNKKRKLTASEREAKRQEKEAKDLEKATAVNLTLNLVFALADMFLLL